MKRQVLLALAFSGCAASASLEQPTLAGNIEIRAPTGWSAHDYSENAHTVLQWTAPPDDDARGTSVLVARVERSPLANVTDMELGQWLANAQQKLPRASFGKPIPFVTGNGFPGVRIEGEFVPPNRHAAYRRLHAVIVDNTALIHLIYTAKQIDRGNFDAIVESFSRKGL